MKFKLYCVLILLALLSGVHQAAAAVLLSDNFDNNSLDLAKWTINTTWNTSGSSTPYVIATNQRVELINRGYLNTVTNYDPSAPGGLLITGTWTILHNGNGDAPTVATRSSGIPLPYYVGSGEVADGVRFKLQPPQNGFQLLILGTGGATVTDYNQISNTLNIAEGAPVSFTITDDGTNLTFNVVQVGSPTNSAYATAVCTNHLVANLISFYNRENSGNSSALDDLVVQTIQPANSVQLTNLVVSPASPVIALGSNEQFTATGYFDDGSMQVLASNLIWSSSSPAVASISTNGLATGLTSGATTITATSGSVTGNITLTVTAVLTNIVVTPANLVIAISSNQQFTATVYFSDGSSQTLTNGITGTSLVWSSSSNAVANISTNGVATGLTNGVTTITATSGSVSGSTALTVGYISITQQPTNVVVTNGGTATFSVEVSGVGPFSYQWRLNGINLPPIITTVAGNGSQGYSGDGGLATSASLNLIHNVAVDSVGNLFIPDTYNQRIRKVGTNGLITTVAGNGSQGYSGDGGLATNAALNRPVGVAVDASGNLFVSDHDDYHIRRVGTNGIITTVAGNGSQGYSGDGGLATNSSLNSPWGLAVDSVGNLLVADPYNNRIRKVDTNGMITTVAGNGSAGYSGDGGAATNAALNYPNGVSLDSAGNVFIADSSNNRIREVGTNGIITTVAGGFGGTSGDGGAATNANFNGPYGVALDAAGNIFIADQGNYRIRRVSVNVPTLVLSNISTNNLGDYTVIITDPSGSVTSSVAALSMPAYVIQPPQPASVYGGNPTNFNVIAEGSGTFTYQWALNGTNISGATNSSYALTAAASTDAGNYTVAVSNVFGGTISAAANLAVHFVSQSPSNVNTWIGTPASFSVTAGGVGPFSYQWALNGTNIVGATNASYGIDAVAVTNGGVYTAGVTNAYGGERSAGATLSVDYITQGPMNLVLTNGGTATFSVGVAGLGPFSYQWQLNGTNVPRILNSSNGIITTVAGNGGQGYAGDGVVATNTSLYYPYDVALDDAGNLFIADNNTRIRKVGTNGIITTVAGNGNYNYSGDGGAATNASLRSPWDVAVDSAGNLFIADQGNQRIRKVDTNGMITTVAGNGSAGYSGDGGAATNAVLNYPLGVTVDGAGNIFIEDSNNRRIRKVDTSGIITTVAGGGNAYPGDGGAATNANLNYPTRMTFDSVGNLLFADGRTIRKVDANGLITTVAGNVNFGGFSGDGGPATSAALQNIYGLALDSAGNLLIADTGNQRIRRVTMDLHTLVLNYISTNNLGDYTVIITAPAGTFTSGVASLSLPLAPRNFAAFMGVGGLQIQLAGSPSYLYILQSSTNLTPPINWQPVITNPADGNGNWSFTVTNITDVPARFYRTLMQ